MNIGDSFTWSYGGKSLFRSVVEHACPSCGARAVVALPEALRAAQPDETTHVCHPSAGGCNQGYYRNETQSA